MLFVATTATTATTTATAIVTTALAVASHGHGSLVAVCKRMGHDHLQYDCHALFFNEQVLLMKLMDITRCPEECQLNLAFVQNFNKHWSGAATSFFKTKLFFQNYISN